MNWLENLDVAYIESIPIWGWGLIACYVAIGAWIGIEKARHWENPYAFRSYRKLPDQVLSFFIFQVFWFPIVFIMMLFELWAALKKMLGKKDTKAFEFQPVESIFFEVAEKIRKEWDSVRANCSEVEIISISNTCASISGQDRNTPLDQSTLIAPGEVDKVLEAMWTEDIHPHLFSRLERGKVELEDPIAHPEALILYGLAPDSLEEKESPWFLCLSKDFLKAIKKIDKPTRARLLTSIAELSAEPLTPRGNTVKPLSGGKSGLWSYRIGDYRLIYSPDSKNRQILILSFAARGGVYSH